MNPLDRLFSIPPVIALLTDFGLLDPYVGVMKGVIASINPKTIILDITHAVNAQNVRQAGFLLWSAYHSFPPRTVFVAVVDPGVGSARRILGVQTPRGTFLAPDNMLLDFVLAEETVLEAVEVAQRENPFALPTVSSTFHGRDIFAPVAAHLASGRELSEMGKRIAVHRPMSPFVAVGTEKSPSATVLHIDRFGNVITNLRAESPIDASRIISEVRLGKSRVTRWIQSYTEAPDRIPCLILGSSGLVEIVINAGSAASRLNVVIGQALKVRWK
jgi:S-adenosylmethionine hydrolase